MNRVTLERNLEGLSTLLCVILQITFACYAFLIFFQWGFNWLALGSLCFAFAFLLPPVLSFFLQNEFSNEFKEKVVIIAFFLSSVFAAVALVSGGLGGFWLHYAIAGFFVGGMYLFCVGMLRNIEVLGESDFEKSIQHKCINSSIRFLYTVLALVSFLYGVSGLSLLGSGMLLGSLGALLVGTGVGSLLTGSYLFKGQGACFVCVCLVTTAGSVLSGIGLFSVAHTLLVQLILGSACFLPALALISHFVTRQ